MLHAATREPVSLRVAGATNANASIATHASQVVVTWAARTGNVTDVYAATSLDGGFSFGPPVRVNDVAGDARVSGEQAPRVAMADRVRVAWCSRPGGASVVRSASAAAGAGAFTPGASVHADGLSGARGWASLAAGSKGVWHVAWLDGRGDGGAASHAASPATAPGTPPSTAPAAPSARHAMRQDLYQAVLSPDGSRHEVRIAADVCFCCKTAVAAGSDGSVYVAWRHIYPPNLRDIAVARSTDGGRTFSAPARVSEDGWAIDGCPDDGPSLAVDARGRLHLAWPTWVSDAEGKAVFYSSSADGGRSFAPRVRIDEGGGAGHPQLALSGARVFVAWDQGGDGERRRVRLRAGALGAAQPPRFGAIVTLSGEGRPASYPSLAAAADGVLAAWSEETPTGSEIRVLRTGSD